MLDWRSRSVLFACFQSAYNPDLESGADAKPINLETLGYLRTQALRFQIIKSRVRTQSATSACAASWSHCLEVVALATRGNPAPSKPILPLVLLGRCGPQRNGCLTRLPSDAQGAMAPPTAPTMN